MDTNVSALKYGRFFDKFYTIIPIVKSKEM